MDPRVERTKALLRDTLLEMADEIGYENVQVSDLILRARISTSTFYRHFDGIEDLLIFVLADSLQNIVDLIETATSQREEAELAFQYVSEHPRLYRLYLSLPVDSPARTILRTAWAQLVLARYQPADPQSYQQEVAMHHIVTSTDALLAWWAERIDVITPAQIADIYLGVIFQAAVRLALVPREDWLRRLD